MIFDIFSAFQFSEIPKIIILLRGGGRFKQKNTLGFFRISGPAGPGLVKRIRPDLMNKYKGLIEEEKLHVVSEYLFHCNAHKPSGESAFHRQG